MNKLARRAWATAVLAALIVAGLCTVIVRYFVDGGKWVTFQNSPHVYNDAGVLDMGTVTDRHGTVVMDTSDGRTYAENASVRRGMLHLLGDSQGYVQHYLLDTYSNLMVGFDRFNGAYYAENGSGSMKLTISAEAQRAAIDALGGRKGTVGVYNYKTGEVLCMVSSPAFDPYDPPSYEEIESDDSYDGVFVNRFVHSVYAPGSTFKLVTAAAALEKLDGIKDRTFVCNGSSEIAGETVICNGVHGTISFEQALCYSCNVAFAEIASELGADTLTAYAEKIGIMDSLSFDGFGTTRGRFDIKKAGPFEVAWAGIGQYTDQINPCQYMTYMGAIANGGKAAEPYLVSEVSFDGSVKYSAKTELGAQVIDGDTADSMAEMMHYTVANNYGEWYFSGLYAGAKSGTAERGEGLEPNALLAGFSQDSAYPLAFVVVVEGGGGGGVTCCPIIRQVLDACIVSMDNS